MSYQIYDNLMTPEWLLSVFQYMTFCEARRYLGGDEKLLEGQMDGYIMCLTDMFGESEPDENEKAYDKGISIYQVTDKILESFKSDLDPFRTRSVIDRFEQFRDLVETKVEYYVSTHYDDCYEALKRL